MRPFPALTVEDNVMVGALLRTSDTARARETAHEVMRRLDLFDKRQREAKSLTLPDRKRLEVARALATAPQLLLLDEVMAGLRPTETDRMVAILRELNAQGLTILLIEHVMRAVMALANRVLVLHHGAQIALGTPAGGHARAGRDRVLSRRGGSLMLSVENIDVFYGDAQALDGVSLEVEEGAIVAIVGANGAGKTSLIRTIAGMLRPGARRDPLSRQRHRGAAELHASAISASGRWRKGRQVFPTLTVAENLDMGAMLPRAQAERDAEPRARARDVSAAARSGCSRRPARCRAASSRCSRSGAA